MFQKKAVEKIKTHNLCSVTFSQNLCRLSDNVEKYCRAGQGTDDNIIRRIACCIPKATNTHSEYVIFFHCNIGYANASHSYAIRTRTLPVLLFFLSLTHLHCCLLSGASTLLFALSLFCALPTALVCSIVIMAVCGTQHTVQLPGCMLEGPGFHPGKGEQYFSSRNHSDKLCGPPILLSKVYLSSFLVVKQPEYEANHSSPHHHVLVPHKTGLLNGALRDVAPTVPRRSLLSKCNTISPHSCNRNYILPTPKARLSLHLFSGNS